MILICHRAHLQPLHWVDEGDGNDGQTEGQYNDGKEPKRSVASSEAPDIAIDVPALQSTRQKKKKKMSGFVVHRETTHNQPNRYIIISIYSYFYENMLILATMRQV